MTNDNDLDQRVRTQRPRAGWTSTREGVETLETIGAPKREDRRPDPRRTWLLAAAVGLVVVAVGATLAIRTLGPAADVAGPRPTNGTVVTIEQGLTYDAEDLSTVMANTDTVFAGTVLDTVGRDEDAGWTTFTVAVDEVIAGEPPAQARVRQHGYVDRQGTLHIIENQKLLAVGSSYVFATNDEPSLDVYTVAPGPWAARPTEPEGRAALVQEYEDAR